MVVRGIKCHFDARAEMLPASQVHPSNPIITERITECGP